MQEEMQRELLKSDPEWFVFVGIPASWLPQPGSDFSFVQWFDNYRKEHLERVGLVELLSDERTEFNWSPSPDATPRTDRWLEIYKKKK
jgi:hypothetical protein